MHRDLVAGLHHLAVVTQDLDRFIEFDADVFGLDVASEGLLPEGRHALLRVGPDSLLHAFEVPDSRDAEAKPAMFRRGHIDHFALTAPTPRRSRSCTSV